jgi:hypothetical protein
MNDPGPRGSSNLVDVNFDATAPAFTFQHNGRPFTSDDLAALLSGGSNKEYDEAADTTGRYGTGFLVTHVLSTQFGLRGVISRGSGYERFEIHLDRSGNDVAILKNADEAERELKAAVPVALTTESWTATFEYPIDNHEAESVGIDTVQLTAPFLYGTCEHLGGISVRRRDGGFESWTPKECTEDMHGEITVRQRIVTHNRGIISTVYRVLRFIPDDPYDVGLVVLLRANGKKNWRVQSLQAELPRVFKRFPIRASTFLPINCVIDGNLRALEERDRIAMDDADKNRIAAALRLIPTAVQLGLQEEWQQCHLLARVARVETAFSESTRDDELTWWNEQLSEVADELARLRMVRTSIGFLPAISDEEAYADFVVPRYCNSTPTDEFSNEEMWDIAAKTTVLYPPLRELASAWNRLSEDWLSLNTKIARLGLKEIAASVRTDVSKLADLPVNGDQRSWLSEYLGLIGKLPASYDGSELANGLLPNQVAEADLCSPAQLQRDAQIPEELKDIADDIGCGVRKHLLDRQLAKRGPTDVIKKLIPNELTESDLLRHAWITFRANCRMDRISTGTMTIRWSTSWAAFACSHTSGQVAVRTAPHLLADARCIRAITRFLITV